MRPKHKHRPDVADQGFHDEGEWKVVGCVREKERTSLKHNCTWNQICAIKQEERD